MRKSRLTLCLLVAALLCGCAKQTAPPVSNETTAPSTEVTTTAPPETPPITTQATEVATETAPTDPTVETTTAAPLPTLPLPTQAVTVPTEGVTLCGHDYQPGVYQAPTCEQAGFQSFRCSKCGDVQQRLSMPLGHSYSEASCTAAQVCSLCGTQAGSALGHRFENGLCSRCGAKDSSVRTITIQIKDSKNAPVDGVEVALYIGEYLDQHAGSAVSTGGRISFSLNHHTGSYKLVLTEIPQGYKAKKDSYTYRSDSGSIVLDIVSVISPDDHSKAAYKVGSTMGDFTVTDVDGKTYQLSRLLQEKKLVILNFWYCTCTPCKAEFPYFNSVYQRYGDALEILALNHFDSESQIRQLRSEMGLTFPLAAENLGMQQGFGIKSYPVSVFIGSDGRILYIQKDVGFETEAELDALVRQLLRA